MSVRDPFGIHRAPTLGILRATASRTAADIRERAIEAGANAIEKGKQAVAVVEDMSFNIPKNIPSFANAQQRMAEDHLWAAATGRPGQIPQHRHHGAGGGGFLDEVREGAGRLLGQDGRTLPMYKDKPYAYPPSHRRRAWYMRKRYWLGFCLVIFIFLWFSGNFDDHKEKVKEHIGKNLTWLKEQDGRAKSNADWLKRRERVVEAFELSWDSYEKHAWGECTLFFGYH